MSDKGVAALRPRPSRYAKSDPELVGHWVRVQPSGSKSFWAVARNPDSKQQVWTFIGRADAMTIAAARERARAILTRVRSGLPAAEPRSDSFGAVINSWLKRHVVGNNLRSHDKIVGLLNLHIGSNLRSREFTAIRRSEITALLDEVEDGHSARQADSVLAVVRSIMNWYAARHDDYVPPLVRGMRRTDPKKRARKRILTDDEIRAVWQAAGECGTFGAFVRILLLTGQRLDKVRTMRWTDLHSPVWEIATSEREKGNAGLLQLPPAALATLAALPRRAGNPFVFAGRGRNPIAPDKRVIDRALAKTHNAKLPRWTLHDLRRTARSLMSRVGVLSEHAERVMGHALPGIEGTYNIHQYLDEKSAALAKLAALIDSIVNPRANVVVAIRNRS
jgi:integrase